MSNQKEKLFFDKLKDIFIGAKIEGESGFINLMKIKSSYFDIIFSELQKEIQEKTKEFPDFKEEMFDKLYTFFKTYFSESGSIYFTYTPLKSKIYEKVYTNNKDVALFWKTHMLYYVKTDKIWHNLTLNFDEEGINYKINFDVSKLEHKKANEKRNIIYELKSIKDKEITFTVIYSEKGKVTKTDEILKEFKKNKIFLDEERLNKIFRIFEKQNEVDYFINKDAEKFLKEQFELWLKDYVLDEKSIFDEKRLKELKVLKEIAFKVIDFVAQFENELVKIWNKPKFVLNSNYVITLDRIKDIKLIEKIIKHKGFEKQCEEWKELGILEKFEKDKLFTQTLKGKELSKEYSKLPIDTKYFDEEIKLEILSQFEDLDKALDGWLIHSENYQALNTILPKFREKVQTIYIDPPFNTGEDFEYIDRFQDASWLTLMDNRLGIAKTFLSKIGSCYLHLDSNADYYGKILLDNLFGKDNFRVKITWKRHTGPKIQSLHFPDISDFILVYSQNQDKWVYNPQYIPYKKEYLEKMYKYEDEKGRYRIHDLYAPGEGPSRIFNGKEINPPKGHHWSYTQDKIDKMLKEGTIFLTGRVFPN
ncbi:MAG: DNA methyltransferase [Candidatus Woesearchaeota archaeon]